MALGHIRPEAIMFLQIFYAGQNLQVEFVVKSTNDMAYQRHDVVDVMLDTRQAGEPLRFCIDARDLFLVGPPD